MGRSTLNQMAEEPATTLPRESGGGELQDLLPVRKRVEEKLRHRTDLRLCTIAGILCSLNLLDSNIISSASVTSMLSDLSLDVGNRYSIAITIFTISAVIFQLPCTMAVRMIGPRLWFSVITFAFGAITICTAFIHSWKEMMVLRVLLGISMSGIYPGLSYLISAWYTREEQQLRFAFMQSGEVVVLASGSILNYGLNHLGNQSGLNGWRWMFFVQGSLACVVGIATYWWIVDFPENAHKSFCFMNEDESLFVTRRIQRDRGDVKPEPFSWSMVFEQFRDVKIYGFAVLFFLLNIVSTSLAYFLPIILEDGMHFTSNQSIILSAPPYYYSVFPALLTSLLGDRLRLRSPFIVFNAVSLILGFVFLGYTTSLPLRYIGTFLATGAYVSNWAALTAYLGNNITGQWKRVVAAATCTMFNGAGGVAGSYIVRSQEAPEYETAVGVSIGSAVVMMGLVGVFTVYFKRENRRQERDGGYLIEKTEGFRYTY